MLVRRLLQRETRQPSGSVLFLRRATHKGGLPPLPTRRVRPVGEAGWEAVGLAPTRESESRRVRERRRESFLSLQMLSASQSLDADAHG